MSEATATFTLDQIMEAAQGVAHRVPRKDAIGLSVNKQTAMAQTLLCLDDVARLAADLLIAGEETFEAKCLELAGALGALGYLTLTTKQEADHGR